MVCNTIHYVLWLLSSILTIIHKLAIIFHLFSNDGVSTELSEVYSRLHTIDADSAPARFLIDCTCIHSKSITLCCYGNLVWHHIQGGSNTCWTWIHSRDAGKTHQVTECWIYWRLTKLPSMHNYCFIFNPGHFLEVGGCAWP